MCRISRRHSARPRRAQSVSIAIFANEVTAVIGPSGCGKSTFVRCLNRMHEVVPGATASGKVMLEQQDIYAMDPVRVRRRIGMVFPEAESVSHHDHFGNVLVGHEA